MTANPLGASTPPTGPDPMQGPSRFRPIDPIKVLRGHIIPLIITGVIGVLIGLGVWFTLRTTSPQFTSTVLLTYQTPAMTPEQMGAENFRGTDAVQLRIFSEVQRIRSQQVIERAIAQPDVQNTAWFAQFETPDQARDALREDHLVVRTQRNSLLIELGVWTQDPSEAPRIVNAVAQAYQGILSNAALAGDEQALASLTNQDRRLDEDIERIRRSLRNFLQNEGIESLQRQGNAAAQEFEILNAQAAELRLSLEQATAQYQQLAEQQAQGDVQVTPDLEAELSMMPGIARRDETLRSLRESKRALLARFGDEHQQIINIDAQIAAVEQEKSSEMRRIARETQAGRLETAGKIVEQLRATLAAMQPRMEEASRKMVDLTERLAQYSQLENDLLRFQRQQEVIRGQLNQITARGDLREARLTIRQITQPTEASMTFPSFIVIVPGITVALLGLVTGIIFVRELLDQRVISPTDIRMLSRGTLLGILPDATEDPSGSGTIDRVVERDANGLIAEQFRQVRTAILRRMQGSGHKSLLLTSAQPGCGTTTIAHNLAASLAQNHRKVILLDANFRRPRLAALLGLSNDRGLADVLRGETSIDQVITPMDDSPLSVVTAGRNTGVISDLFDTVAFSNLVEQLSNRYDFVILDGPPALLSSDSQLMAKSVDAVAAVVKAGTDKRGMADRMLRQLDGDKAEVLGVILNWVQSSAGGYFRKSYQAYYDYQSADESQRLSA
ncbi:GumC family protein [Mucisphaera sp.]|uniref:GumC family protein n=1 Tax=Mucisphaera sp. TaxID=2913024 RepID=UPI003D1283F0